MSKSKPCTNSPRCKSAEIHFSTCPVYKAVVKDWEQHPEKYLFGPGGMI